MVAAVGSIVATLGQMTAFQRHRAVEAVPVTFVIPIVLSVPLASVLLYERWVPQRWPASRSRPARRCCWLVHRSWRGLGRMALPSGRLERQWDRGAPILAPVPCQCAQATEHARCGACGQHRASCRVIATGGGRRLRV
jgi:hypothetical protein